MREKKPADITVERTGPLFLVRPHTPVASEWLEVHVAGSGMRIKGGVVMEYRYCRNLVDVIQEHGLTVA